MKRVHRRAHLIMWLILAPGLATLIWLAIAFSTPAPLNDSLPATLVTEPA